MSGRISTTVDKDLPISSLAAGLEDGKKYSFYQSGFYNATTKTIDAFIVEDPIPAEVDWTAARVRFVHAISNANPMTYMRGIRTGEEVAIGQKSVQGRGSVKALRSRLDLIRATRDRPRTLLP